MESQDYRIGRFTLKPFRQLFEGDVPVAIGRKALVLLTVLARAEGALVTKDELMAAVWPNAIVEDNAMQVHIVALRKALGPAAENLRTVHGLGYRLELTRSDAEVPGALANKPSIAVMPFANLSGDPEQDSFVDGMVEEIVTALARFRSIFVIGSGSTLSFRGKAVSSEYVGRSLGVRYMLEGSVRKAGGRVRISVKLSEAASGAQVLVDKFEDTLLDVFALQDRVALGVAGKIEPTVEVAETRRATAMPAESLGSYELYLRAWALERTFAKDNVLAALELLNRAIILDPDFAPALALASICHRVIFNFRWTDDPESVRRRGVELGRRALSTGADDARVLANVASALGYLEPGSPDATRLLDRALALNPGSSTVWFYSGVRRLQLGETDVGLEHLDTALCLDPIGPVRPNLIGFQAHGRFQQRRFAEAVLLLRELVQESETPRGYGFLAACLGQLGRTEEAGRALARYRTLTPQPIDEFARAHLLKPVHRAMFMRGIALAEAGGSPTV
ncbi:MAG TPA: winged helix-turn-helix domain-containing protein [Caulobacteraceae bacterium]